MSVKFNIVRRGSFRPWQLSVMLQHGMEPSSFPAEVESYVERKWIEAGGSDGENARLFNGRLFSLLGSSVSGGVLRLRVAEGDYKHYYASRTDEFIDLFGQAFHVNALSVGTLVETRDNKIFFGTRNDDLDVNPGRISVPAGAIDPNKDMVDGSPSPFMAIYREVEEETGILHNELQDLRCIGLVDNLQYRQSYLAFYARTSLASFEIQKRIPSEIEFVNVTYTGSERAQLARFLEDHESQMAQNCIANIRLHLESCCS